MEHLDFLDLFPYSHGICFHYQLGNRVTLPAPLGDAHLNLYLSSLLNFYLFSFQVVSYFYPTGRVLEPVADIFPTVRCTPFD